MITLTINGKVHQTEVELNEVLLDTLRGWAIRVSNEVVKRPIVVSAQYW